MALNTAGTDAATTLTGLEFQSAGIPAADQALLAAGIQDDLFPLSSGADAAGFYQPNSGRLFIPNRGVLTVRPGDWIVFDPATGWPLLISARAMAGANWNHS